MFYSELVDEHERGVSRSQLNENQPESSALTQKSLANHIVFACDPQ